MIVAKCAIVGVKNERASIPTTAALAKIGFNISITARPTCCPILTTIDVAA